MTDPLDGIAIIGLTGRFPGAADAQRFWANLCNGVESITRFAPDTVEDPFTPAQRAETSYVPARPILDGIDLFDAAFFGMQSREAALTDPQHRLFLECCWEAFEDAGYDPVGSNTGVFAGCSMPTYLIRNVLAGPGARDAFTGGYQVEDYQQMLGSLGDTLATRVSYRLDLRGPSMTLQTACSTSLVAVAQACQALMIAQCDLALAGGISVTVPQRRGYRHTEGGIVSADGHCRPFDASATGTVFGDGGGVVLLKRLSDALADGDRIHAVIRGFAVNNDGAAKAGFAAPSVNSQAAAIATAHAMAGVGGSAIGYVECHGTATPLGDPIEVAGLTRAFRASTEALGFCALGSVKGNVGHLDVGAGITGLIKTVLAVREGLIPPTLHYGAPNPQLGLEDSPFYVAARLTPWPTSGTPRIAGVSALGVGGTNVHVVVAQPPAVDPPAAAQKCQLLTLSARSEAALLAAESALAARLRNGPKLALADVAHTLRRRRGFAHRSAVVARNCNDAAALLEGGSTKRGVAADVPPSVLFMFPGQGTQYPDMGGNLYRMEPTFRAEFDLCADVVEQLIGQDLRKVLYGGAPDAAETLRQTSIAQPAIFAASYALARLWMARGIRPGAMIGHSVGEFVAATIAGVFRVEDAVRVVAERGRLMQLLPGGVMLSVRLSHADLAPLLGPGLDLAAVNGAALSVVAGPHDAVAALEVELLARGTLSRRLHTSHAFHSAMMAPVVKPLAAMVQQIKLSAPMTPYVSSVTGKWITAAEAQSPGYWARHCREPVRFADGIATLLTDSRPGPVLLEVGPGNMLSMLVSNTARASAATVLTSLSDETADDAVMADVLGRLWIAGVQPNWQNVEEGPRRVVSLPTYPFERSRHWIDVQPSVHATASPVGSHSTDMQAESRSTVTTGTIEMDAHHAVLAVMQDLSGVDLLNVPDDVTFLELGFDSLVLSQVAQELQGRFNVKLTFRQLLGDLATLSKLTRFIVASLPNSAALTAPASVTAVARAPDQEAATAGTQSVATMAVERLLRNQMQTLQQLMSAQLDALRNLRQMEQPAATMAAPPAGTPTTPSGETELAHRFRRFSAPAMSPELTEKQRKFLAEFIARYTARTAKSKAIAQAYRAVHADPRTASGFSPQWKEIVYPLVCDRAAGSRLWDVDGNVYVDLVNGFGATLFGHSPDFVLDALASQQRSGFPVGPQAGLAGHVATLISELTGDERITFCCTGSEAVMGALRLARAVTGRERVVAFAGAYHGGFDEVLVRGVCAGGNPRTLPAAAGVLPNMVANMTILEYGEPASLAWIRDHANDLAAVLVEPVQSRHPDLQPRAFLQSLREITEGSGSALIFDEVVTGFRLHQGGTQAMFGIRADLATYGKVLGGGLPIGILAGKSRFMNALDGGFWRYGDASGPQAAVTVFAGTFVRHPLALAAAAAVLEHLKAAGPALQEGLCARTGALVRLLNANLERCGVRSRVEHCGSMFHFSPASEDRRASLFFHLMRDRGVMVQESFPMFLTTAHTDEDVGEVVRAFEAAIADLQSVGIFAGRADATHAVPSLVLDAVAHATEPSRKLTALAAPVTEPQLEVLLSAQLGDDASCAFNESVSVALTGALDRPALRAALHDLATRHDALRAHIAPAGDVIHIAPDATLQMRENSPPAGTRAANHLVSVCAEEVRTPFDLFKGPLMRAVLVHQAPERHVLIITAHHIICDGWSTNIILQDLAALYEARRSRRPATLKGAPSFLRHAAAERAGNAPEAAAADAAFWTRQFANLPKPLELPLDRPRPAVKTFRGATVTETVDAALYGAVRVAGARLGCTPFATLLAAFHALLGRLADQQDVVVGVPTAGQRLLTDPTLVGHCVNFLPLRALWDAKTSLADHMKAVQAALSDAQDHPRCTLGTLVRGLGIQRNPNRLPLTDVQFNLERLVSPSSFGGMRAAVTDNAKAFVNFDVFFNLVETPAGLILDCSYSTDLFDEATIRRWIGHYRTLLAAFTKEPTVPVIYAAILTPSERLELRDLSGVAGMRPLEERRFHELVTEQALRRPDVIAAVCGVQEWTYSQLDRRAEEIAAHLVGRITEPEARVGILMERSLDLLAALLAVAKAGLTYVPLDPRFPKPRLSTIIKQSDLAALLVDGIVEIPDTVIISPIDLSQPLCPVPVLRADEPIRAPNALAYVIYTSGSTGTPKGVEIGHSALTNLIVSMSDRPGLAESDVLLAVTTVAFDIAALELLLPLTVGARVVLASSDEAADGFALLSLLQRQRVNVLQATPATWRLLLEAGFRSQPGFAMLCGGEALTRALADQLLAGGGALWNMYGPTETTIWSSVSRVVADDKPITIGEPIANTRLYVLDRHGELAAPGVLGQLAIGGAGLAQGYFHDTAQTSEKFIVDPFEPDRRMYLTGDLAQWRPNGGLRLLGRIDRQIKLRGFRIEPCEIESALLRAGAAAAAVTLHTDPKRGARLVAYYVVPHGRSLDARECDEALTVVLPRYMVPAAYVRLTALPLTPSGKVDEHALPAPRDEEAWRTARTPLTTTLQQQLGKIWKEVLGLDEVGADDDLLTLGADSIHIFQFAARASRVGIAAAAKDFLHYRTIAALSIAVENRAQEVAPATALPHLSQFLRSRRNL